MRIGERVAGVRRKLNDSVGDNFFTRDIDLRKSLRIGLVGLVIVGGGVVNSGCVAAAVGVAGYYAGKDAGGNKVKMDTTGWTEEDVYLYNEYGVAPRNVLNYRITDTETGKWYEGAVYEDGGVRELLNMGKKHRKEFPNGFRIDSVNNGDIKLLMKWKPQS